MKISKSLSITIAFLSFCALQGCGRGPTPVTAAASPHPVPAAISAQASEYANSILDRMQAMPAPIRRSYAKKASPEMDFLRGISDPAIKARFQQLSQ